MLCGRVVSNDERGLALWINAGATTTAVMCECPQRNLKPHRWHPMPRIGVHAGQHIVWSATLSIVQYSPDTSRIQRTSAQWFGRRPLFRSLRAARRATSPRHDAMPSHTPATMATTLPIQYEPSRPIAPSTTITTATTICHRRRVSAAEFGGGLFDILSPSVMASGSLVCATWVEPTTPETNDHEPDVTPTPPPNARSGPKARPAVKSPTNAPTAHPIPAVLATRPTSAYRFVED
jgi:hypothetical protein